MPTNCISAQCKILGISRGSYYYEVKPPKDESHLEKAVKETFEENRGVYGSPKLKKALAKKKIIMSKRKICRIMDRFGLVSAYTHKKHKKRRVALQHCPVYATSISLTIFSEIIPFTLIYFQNQFRL